MNIYISGISGTGMGPLALMAKAAGFQVCGSDLSRGAIYDELVKAGIEVFIGEQDGMFLREKIKDGVDWFCYTSALTQDHPELLAAKEAGIKCTKRDDLTAFLVNELGLKMVAVAGTHGKTTTTAMIVWAALKLRLPVAYIVGTTLGFATSGAYHAGDKYFVYEADEYDRNFLKYHPWLAIITSVSYDHPDIYKIVDEYRNAFRQFEGQSEEVIGRGLTVTSDDNIEFDDAELRLAGKARREDERWATLAIMKIAKNEGIEISESKIVQALNQFPGVGRRFERISDGTFTDYAHHPEEVAATVNVAKEQAELDGRKGVVVVYQPHQNTRQHEVMEGYRDAFLGVEKIFWLPTYLTRENPELRVLTPEDLIKKLSNREVAEVAELDEELEERLKKYLDDGYLVIMMTAGPADGWMREKFGG